METVITWSDQHWRSVDSDRLPDASTASRSSGTVFDAYSLIRGLHGVYPAPSRIQRPAGDLVATIRLLNALDRALP